MELVRCDCSSTLGAALANQLFHDIRHLLRPDIDIAYIMTNKSRIDKANPKEKTI